MINSLHDKVLRYRRITLFLILSFFVYAPSASAQAARSELTLNEAISLTLAENAQLYQFSLKRAGLVGRRAASDVSPELNLDIDLENFGGIGGNGESSGVDGIEATIALSSVIELGSKRNARVSVADARVDILEYQKQAFTLNVLGELTAIFVKTLELQELMVLVKEARDVAQNTLEIVESRSRQGATPESEVQRARAVVARVQLQLAGLIHQHDRHKIKLASFWGEMSPQWLNVRGDLYAFGQQPDFTELYQQALLSPAIEVFGSETRLKTAELQLAKTESKADIGWRLGVRRSEETGTTSFTAGMSIPLFSGSRNKGHVAMAMAERDEVAYKRQSSLLRLHSQLYDAYSQRKQHINAVKVFQVTVIPELTAAVASTQRAYETGRYSYQDWIAAQQELLRAKETLIENAASAILNQAVIEQLTAEPFNR